MPHSPLRSASRYCLIAVLLLGAGVSLAQQEQPAPALPETTQTALPVPVSVATPTPSFLPWIGERADYHVAFGVISAGKAASVGRATGIRGSRTSKALPRPTWLVRVILP